MKITFLRSYVYISVLFVIVNLKRLRSLLRIFSIFPLLARPTEQFSPLFVFSAVSMMFHIHLGFLQNFLFLGLALGSGQIYSGVKKSVSDESG